MKVLLINGSPRKNGNTNIALKEVVKVLDSKGIECEIVWIGNKPVRGCISCGKCFEKPGQCTFNDDICNTISQKFQDMDALVIGSPVYYGQPNGALLAILQRAFYSNTANVAGKPAASIAICRRGGASAAFQTLNLPMQMLNMPIITSQYWNIAYGMNEGDTLKDAEGLQTMRTLANNLAFILQSTKGKPSPGTISGEEWTPTHFIR